MYTPRGVGVAKYTSDVSSVVQAALPTSALCGDGVTAKLHGGSKYGKSSNPVLIRRRTSRPRSAACTARATTRC